MARSDNLDDYGDVLTLADVAAIMKVHLETVRLWAREGKLPAKRAGRSYFILKAALVEWLTVVDEDASSAAATRLPS